MNKEYLSFLEWNKEYYGQIHDRVNKVEFRYKLWNIVQMYLEYIGMYIDDYQHLSNCDHIFKTKIFFDVTDNPDFNYQVHRLDKEINLIIYGSEPITDEHLKLSNMVHYYDWSYLMNTDENGELDRHKLIAYQGLGKW
jgi:hypothetical protein